MVGGNDDVFFGGHRSVIEEHGVITFVAQIPRGKSKPETDILGARKWLRARLLVLLLSLQRASYWVQNPLLGT
jgi:hypothetical protein